MITEKDLVPGRVITTMERKWAPMGGPDVIKITAWLIIGFTVQVKRRHNAKKARKDGWHVLLLSFGGKLTDIHMTPASMQNYRRLI